MIVQKLLGKPFEVGYNAMYDRVEDLIEAGILDPAKVTRSGLINACSIAGIMLTTQVCVCAGGRGVVNGKRRLLWGEQRRLILGWGWGVGSGWLLAYREPFWPCTA